MDERPDTDATAWPAPAVADPVTPPAVPVSGAPAGSLGWKIFKNSAAQVGGRAAIAVLRLAIAGVVVRTSGKAVFGEYSLVLGMLTLADWLVDFGTTDVFVREYCRNPERGPTLLRTLTATKLVQVPAAVVFLVALPLALRYPTPLVQAVATGAIGLVFFAGTLVYRALFRATLSVERDVFAEIVSAGAMLAMVYVAASHGATLLALVGCYVGSRAIYLAVSYLLGRSWHSPSLEGTSWPAVALNLRGSVSLGFVGFAVGVYETIDVFVLSKLSSLTDLAYFSGAQRLSWPLLMAAASVGATFYPVYASLWVHDRGGFARALQRGLDGVLLLAGLGASSLVGGATFYMRLLGPDLVPGAPALRVLAVLCVVKALSATVGPMLYVVNAQGLVVRVVLIATLAKVVVLTLLAPRFGFLGVAVGSLAVEACCAALPSVVLVQRLTGSRPSWSVGLKVAAIALLSCAGAALIDPAGRLPGALIAPGLYSLLAPIVGALRLSDLRPFLRVGSR